MFHLRVFFGKMFVVAKTRDSDFIVVNYWFVSFVLYLHFASKLDVIKLCLVTLRIQGAWHDFPKCRLKRIDFMFFYMRNVCCIGQLL